MKTIFFYFAFAMTLLISKNCFSQTTHSIKLNPFNSYDSDVPPIEFDLDHLQKPVLFILDNKRLKGDEFSKLGIDKNNIESIIVIQDEIQLEQMGCKKLKSLVLIKSEK